MKKIIKVTYNFHKTVTSIKYFLVADTEGLEKLQEQETMLYSDNFKISFTEIDVSVAKFLTIDQFKDTELLEFIKIMEFVKNEQ